MTRQAFYNSYIYSISIILCSHVTRFIPLVKTSSYIHHISNTILQLLRIISILSILHTLLLLFYKTHAKILWSSCLMLEIKNLGVWSENREVKGRQFCWESNPSAYWVGRCVSLRHFSTTCAVHIEDCKGWWFSGCHNSVAEHQLHKPEMSWVQFLVTAGPFTFLYLAS